MEISEGNMTRKFAWRSAVLVLGVILATADAARGNGYEFFVPLGDRAKLDLVYVGQIREKGTRNLVREPAYVMVTDNGSGMTFPFDSDRPGHYRSPDVGASIKELGGTVKASDLEIQVAVPGYKTAKVTNVPRTINGIVEVNVELERDGGNASAASDASDASAPPQGSQPSSGSEETSSRIWLFGITALVVMGGIAARTLGPRQSTAR